MPKSNADTQTHTLSLPPPSYMYIIYLQRVYSRIDAHYKCSTKRRNHLFNSNISLPYNSLIHFPYAWNFIIALYFVSRSTRSNASFPRAFSFFNLSICVWLCVWVCKEERFYRTMKRRRGKNRNILQKIHIFIALLVIVWCCYTDTYYTYTIFRFIA